MTASDFHPNDESSSINSTETDVPRVQTDFYRDVRCILGLPFDAVTMDQAQANISEAVRTGRRCFFSTPNLNFLIGCLDDEQFRNSVIRSDLSLADGMPLIWIARLLGIPVTTRVAGSTLFERLRQQSVPPIRVFFFGGPDGVAKNAGVVLNKENKGMTCVGARSPGFGTIDEMSSPALINEINDSTPDFLVVALGARRGQAWIENNLQRLNVPVVSHLGAVVNFVAGTIIRAPEWISRLGLEWAWRIKEEPALWRRYWADGIALVRLLMMHVVPGLWLARRAGKSQLTQLSGKIDTVKEAESCLIMLEGHWHERNIASLRTLFIEMTSDNCNITIDLKKVIYFDSACIGLLILLFGHQLKAEKVFKLVNLSTDVVNIFNIYCVEYLSGQKNYFT